MPSQRVTHLIGAGGHAKVIADILIECGRPPAAFLDDASQHNRILGITVIKGLELPEPGSAVIGAVGRRLESLTARATIPACSTLRFTVGQGSRDAEIGPGTVVMAGAVINPGKRVASHCIINTDATVDHDCLILSL